MSETTPSAVVTATQAVPAAPRSAKRPARPRKANAGDIAPSLQGANLERHTVNEAIAAEIAQIECYDSLDSAG